MPREPGTFAGAIFILLSVTSYFLDALYSQRHQHYNWFLVMQSLSIFLSQRGMHCETEGSSIMFYLSDPSPAVTPNGPWIQFPK